MTPIWRVWQEVGARAAEAGVEVRESELIGLCPLAALLEVADYAGVPAADDETRIRAAAEWARIRDFEPTMALELRLATFAGER